MVKKVIFVSNFVGNGGAGRVMSLIANYFSENHINVTICSFSDDYDTYPINKNINNILMKPKYKRNNIAALKKIKRILLLRKVFRNNPGATIISFEYFVNMQTIIAAFLLKNRVIISERNDPSQLNKRKHMKIARDILYLFADLLVCQTKDAKHYFSKYIRKKTIIIPNPISSNLPERYTGIRKKEIVNFCRIEPQKNLSMMIDAFRLLQEEYPDYILSIYGDGSDRAKIFNYINKIHLSDKVKIHDFTFDIHSKIYNCSIFVSSSNYEGISNSMLEAMGMGLPSVVTDCPCGGARMFIKSYENGILVPVGDTKAFYLAMKYIIENPEEAEKMSEKATEIKEKLAPDKIYIKWMEVL
jgi:glycosyltransferase involved in cell wall biosynthesis